MTRMARIVIPGHPHHVTQYGNRKQRTFFSDSDYRRYLDLIAEHTRKSGTEVWAYCLMPNHIHLVMVPGKEDGLCASMAEAHRRYTQYINLREGWCDHLSQERVHSFVMDENYLLAAVRYVERNPVTAGLCECPHQWKWSSARAHMDGKNDALVNVRPMLDRIDNWYKYLSDNEKYYRESDLIERHARTGRPLGRKAFIRKLENTTGVSLLHGKPRKKPDV